VRAKEARVQPNARNLLADQPRILSRRYRSVPTATAAEEELARFLTGGSYVTVDGLTGLLRDLKPDGLAGLLLAYGRTIEGVTMRRNVFHPQANDVASPKLAIDG
jgi:hypothetical protein